jgi:accessory Sec system S-layer assembly protein
MARLENKENNEELRQNPIEQADEAAVADTVETTLHFPEQWDIPAKERYVYQFHHSRLPKLKANQLSISGYKFTEVDGKIEVEAFIRSTVDRPVQIEAVDLILFDETGQLAARKHDDWDELGELPPFSCIPWRFTFTKEDRLSDATVNDKWQVLFELKQKAEETLDLDPAWEERLTPEKKAHFENLLTKLPKLRPKEVNITGVELTFLENQSLEVIVLIRNGTEQEVQISQLPLIVEDATGEIVCQGQFTLPPLKVKPKGAKPWAFVYPAELIGKPDADFSKWKILVKQNK